MPRSIFALLLGVFIGTAAPAFAQKLPPPSRTVYKCDVDGKVIYSDAPCLGARKLDVEPTRGVNKLSGKEQVGADVRREQFREQLAEAWQPLTGLNAKEFEVRTRRNHLVPEVQRECYRLDDQLLALERREAQASDPQLGTVQADLFRMRGRFRQLGC